MKVALVHDYLGEFGGAERVLEALCEIFPEAPIYTAFWRKGSAYDRFKKRKIVTSWAQNVPFFSSFLVSPLRFLAPLIWGSFNFSDYDVVITSASWYVTKGFKKNTASKKPVEICYCHTPPRYLYGYSTSVNWKKHWYIRLYALIVNHFMRVYDYEAAQRVDYFIANSKEVAGRIKKFYRRDSEVVYPPVDTDKLAVGSSKSEKERGYFLVVSRLVASKNVELAIQACKKLKLPLKVVGTGKAMTNLQGLTHQPTIQFLGDVDDNELVALYQNCLAVIFPASQEDFGLVPVEAMAAGKPVIALKEGGVLETVIDGKTGLFFNEPKVGSVVGAIAKFTELERKGAFDEKFIQKHAQKFSKERFKKEILEFVKKIKND